MSDTGQSVSDERHFSTGAPSLDHLLEQVRAGDNVVFYVESARDYVPFAKAMVSYALAEGFPLVYVRSEGALDDMARGATVVDLANGSAAGGKALDVLAHRLRTLSTNAYVLFEPLDSYGLWMAGNADTSTILLNLCPQLYEVDSVAYWAITKGSLDPSSVAAVVDCTQIFLDVGRRDHGLYVTPTKVWGRFSDTMFRSHQVFTSSGRLYVEPQPLTESALAQYSEQLAAKNQELASIRDALNGANQVLSAQNVELVDLNARLLDQNRAYQSLRLNLDHLTDLLRAGQDIASSLAEDKVRRAIVVAALHLFDAHAGKLQVWRDLGGSAVLISEGAPEYLDALSRNADWLEDLRERAGESDEAVSARAQEYRDEESAAAARLVLHGETKGLLQIYARHPGLDSAEVRSLLGYLASEASIALDNASLYRETAIQSEQLRAFVDAKIMSEEQDSRRLAFDLHDGPVQTIVAAYQHLQTAQVMQMRDPSGGEKELAHGIRLLRQSIYEARRLISGLRPAGLDDFGLIHALRAFAAEMSSQEWHLDLHVAERWGKLPSGLEAAIFRIVQEGVTNSRRYSGADRADVSLSVGAENLQVVISDRGRGFDPDAVPSQAEGGQHMGLVGIRERARFWGGTCHVIARPGSGAMIRVRIPLTRALSAPGEAEA